MSAKLSNDAPSDSPKASDSSAAAPHPQARSIVWWLSRLTGVGLFLAAGVLLITLLGVAQRVGWLQESGIHEPPAAEAGQQTTFTCPMHPQIRQPTAGRCPICGMALVPATSTGADLDRLAVTIEPAQRRLANIQTAKVTKQPISTAIQTIGAIQIDESRQSTIAAYIDGRVERLFADYTGVKVEKGDHLAVVYSPQLFSAQVEYVEARRTLKSMSGAALEVVRETQQKLATNSRQKLVELGMTEEQIGQLESTAKPQSRLTIYAPIGGTVIEKLAEEGKYISAGEPIYRIANLSTVWLMLELYPEDASRIRFGQVVRAELGSLPGKTLIGRVAFIDPTVSKTNRTVGVRVEFKNDNGRLRPGDYAKATIEIPLGSQGEVFDKELAGRWISPMHPQVIRDKPGDCPICGMKLVPTSRYGYTDEPVPQTASVVVPRSALLMAGDHSVVYVETDPGRFELRNVTLGPILKTQAVVLSGVTPGEKVATSGNFLIDSQMQLAGNPSLIDPMKFEAGTKQDDHKEPLQFESIKIERVVGPAGEKLERFYAAYFDIQRELAADKQPGESPVKSLIALSSELAANDNLPKEARQELGSVKKQADHLHHLPIDKARQNFKAISQAVVTLSTQVRGEQATRPFQQFFCPMVKQGAGDWLQADEQLRNPYFGSEMLRCGELVRTIPPEEKNDSRPIDRERN